MKNLMVLPLLAAAVGCFGGESKSAPVAMSKAPADGKRPADDIAIVTTDGAMTMAVRADSIRMRFSDSSRKEINKDLDTSKVQGNGFGASIEKMVKEKVQTGFAMEVTTPVSELEDARYEDGGIVLVYRDKSKKSPFSGTSVNNKPLLKSFSQQDSEKMVAYLKSHLQQR
jgi:hypothetical protein